MGNLNLTEKTASKSRSLPSPLVRFIFAFLGFVLFLWPGLVAAQSSPHGFTKSQTAEGLRYMAGGISIDERQVMAEQSDDYNLKLIFAEKAGIYMADVKVAVENNQGEEIGNITSPGPWFYIQLPPGRYNVKASFEGNTTTIRNISVGKSQQTTRIFHWDLAGEPEHPELLSQVRSEKGT